jgi:cellulose synthase/poly-beta-1,6-N-acetylglucosamine synthase-like glycosyltransferase
MTSVIITTYQEPETLKKSLDIILNEIGGEDEILVVGPDIQTEGVVKRILSSREICGKLLYIRDRAEGKPAALNLAFQKARGEILVLTDGDVWPEKGFLEKLIRPFNNLTVGAVSGHPVSLNSRNTMFGFWSHFLVEAAHQRRLELSLRGEYLDCSGYLYALRKSLISNFQFPNSVLSEDTFISQHIWQRGYKIAYAPEAKIFVRYPENFKDWILQKRRSTGGYLQKIRVKNQKLKIKKMRSFLKETFYGTYFALAYPKNLKELWYTGLLFLARLYLWLLIFFDHKILRKKFSKPWPRVESTK